MMGGYPGEHGYGSHRRESFSTYYRRNILSEGCGCAEQVLGERNRQPLEKLDLRAWGRALADRLGFGPRTDSQKQKSP